ncbi:MAG: hypothetical protein AMXMBFR7_38860 [Planctomycetota bacterium]
MSENEIVGVCLLVIRALEALGIPYELGGSMASSLLGAPRSTRDADLVADLSPAQARTLAESLHPDFVSNADSAASAVVQGRSFNLIHLGTMLKVDIFPVKAGLYWRGEFARRLRIRLPGDSATEVWCTSPEDIVLKKLVWYRDGGSVSERQWQDLLEVLRAQRGRLDEGYLSRWADDLGVAALLKQAQSQAQT